MPALFVPEFAIDGIPHLFRQAAPFPGPLFVADPAADLFHDAQPVVPQRLNLDGFSRPGSDHPIPDFGIHPGERSPCLPGQDQSIDIHVDVKVRAVLIVFDDAFHGVPKLILHKIKVFGIP